MAEIIRKPEYTQPEDQKRKTWVEVFAAYLSGKIKKFKEKLNVGIAQIQELNKEIKENSNNHNPSQFLEKIQAKLEATDKAVSGIEEISRVPVIERKVNKLRKLQQRIQKQIDTTKEEVKRRELQQQQEDVEEKEVTLLIREVYKNDTKKIPPDSKLLGRKKALLEKFANASDESGKFSAKELTPNDKKELRDYHAELRKLRIQQGERETDKPASELNMELQKEIKSYRETAQIKDLLERLQDKDTYMSPNQQNQLVTLLKDHYENVKKDTTLKPLVEDLLVRISDGELSNHTEELTSALTKVENIQGRQEIIEEHKQKLQEKLFGETNNKAAIVELFEKTNYEKQIENHMRAQMEGDSDGSIKEMIYGLEEMNEKFMREYESLKKTEREGPLKQRIELARSFARGRIMEEFANVERVRALYGETYGKEFEEHRLDKQTIESDERALETALLEEIETRFALSDDGSKIELPINTSEEEKTQKLQESKDAFKEIQTQLENIIKTQRANRELIDDPQKRAELIKATKWDLQLARLKSEAREDKDRLEELSKLQPGDDLSTYLTSEITEQIDDLFKNQDANTGGKYQAYEIISTPNGLAFAFSDTEKLTTAILGNIDETQRPESIAITLQSNNAVSKKFADNSWNGSIMFVATDRGEADLMHEVQHATLKELQFKSEDENSEATKFNSHVEELAIKLATGEVWDELSLPDSVKDPKRNSLTALAYVTERVANENPEQAKLLYQFLEMSKQVSEHELRNSKNEDDSVEDAFVNQNIYGSVMADILISNINPNDGSYDIQSAITQLQEAFKGEIELKIPDVGTLDEKILLGVPSTEEMPSHMYDVYSQNPGFEFSVISSMDTRGRANITHDAFFDPRQGTNDPMQVGVLPASEIPLVSGLLSPLWSNVGKKRGSPGPIEYHVGGPLSYKIGNRAYGGVLRKLRSVPVLGLPLRLIPERRIPFRASSKIFNYLPPFGRANELIVKDLFPGFDEWMTKKFPARPETYEALTPNATELWSKQINILFANLGQEGLGLSQAQVQRVMGELPGIAYEFELGRPKFEVSSGNLDEIDETGKHRGRITQRVLDGVTSSKFQKKGKPELNDETAELAETMMNSYDRKDYPYTLNDLMNAAHQIHDLGISPLTGRVRNEYYQSDAMNRGFTQEGDLMIGDHMWFSIKDPNKRGVIVDGERYSIEAAHDLIRRYNTFHIYDALERGLPTITAEMQENEFDPDPLQRIADPRNPSTPLTYEKVQQLAASPTTLPLVENYITISRGRVTPNSDHAWYYDPETQETYLCKAKLVNGNKVRNRFPSGGFGAQGIPGVGGYPMNEDERKSMAEDFLRKLNYDLDSAEGGFKTGYRFLNDYVRRLAEASEYERKAYYAKTFWGDTKEWIQRFGKVILTGSALMASFTGMPVFAGIFLGWGAFQLLSVNFMQHREKVMGSRRIGALELQEKLGSQMGMYEKIMKGESLSRLEQWQLRTVQNGNEAKVEDLAKAPVPDGAFPGDDWAHKFMGGIFGGEGAIMRSLSNK